MSDKRRYRFTEEKDSVGGKRALLFALASALCFVVSVVLSFVKKGEAGPYVGAITISGALLSIYGFKVGMQSFAEKNVSPSYSVLGAILSGVVMVGYFALFLVGIGRL